MTIYIDISQLEKTRANTGIQRVLKEFLLQVVSFEQKIDYKIISLNRSSKKMELLDNREVKQFLSDLEYYQLEKREPFDIFNIKAEERDIFFDIDSVWSVKLKREKLYPILKKNGFLIFNFLYDLIPIVLPHVAHKITVGHFVPFIDAVCQYSDMVFFDSRSAEEDFVRLKDIKTERNIPTRVVGLGSDFFQKNQEIDPQYSQILQKKYILFVGTIEPRKNQAQMLDAFEILAEKHADLNLVFIGRQGWNVQKLINRLTKHPLKDKQLFWFNNIDDQTLNRFYQNAFIVTYLSQYEGYGLPIVESLGHGNITITSKNSSMFEAGRDCADYIVYNSQNELVELIELYYNNSNLYHQKKLYIKQNFHSTTWTIFANSLINIFNNFEKSIILKENPLKRSYQFVIISIDIENLKGTIKAIDTHIDFVKEYIVVTAPKYLKDMKNIRSSNQITIIDENLILKEYAKDFHLKDHQHKNWLLRCSLLNLDNLESEFIMLDDDNRPLKKIDIEFFISHGGRYNAYYFYNLLEWNHKATDYDRGQQNTKNSLSRANYELLSYSSHAPQIINREIFKEAVDKFFEIGLKKPIDEWSIYFNYAISNYPYLFNKKLFETQHWPPTPLNWEYQYAPKSFSFDNYYKEQSKIKALEIEPFLNSRDFFKEHIKELSVENSVYGVLSFKKEEMEFYLFSIPPMVTIEKDSDIRLKLNYKLFNPKQKHLDISVELLLNGKPRTSVKIDEIDSSIYQESVIEVPILSFNLRNSTHNLSFNINIGSEPCECPKNRMKLTVVSTKELKIKLERLKTQSQPIVPKLTLKERIRSLPFIGWFSRWGYNLLRLNYIKHTLFIQQNRVESLIQQVNRLNSITTTQAEQIKGLKSITTTQAEQLHNQRQQITHLVNENHKHHEQYKKIEDRVHQLVSKAVSNQSILFHQRIEQFIISLEHKISTPQAITEIKDKTPSIILDDYYLAFENIFRGKREDIKERYQPYLKYLNSDIKTAFDIGCGRGEWVEILQQNSIDAMGVDLNFAMLNIGTDAGVKHLHHADAFAFLKSCKDNSFDLVSAFHIIEHIPYEELFILLQEIKRVSTPNAVILLETPNPANLLVASYEFYKDPTHLNPLPSDVIKFMVEYMGFRDVKVDFLHPFPNTEHIQEDSQTASRLNSYLYKERDYLIVAKNAKQRESHVCSNIKPKLAYISPMPPQRSGISDYSAELIPHLEKYYTIDVITQLKPVGADLSVCPIRSVEWFKSNYNQYSRVLYHFGNSAFHTYMVNLLDTISGVVVLHDFYLCDLMLTAKRVNQNSLYALYGYRAVKDYEAMKLGEVVNAYPCNKDILNGAISVITHSKYPKILASKWYAKPSMQNWYTIPLLRTPIIDKKSQFKEGAFVVATFGLLSANKMNRELLEAWMASSLHQNSNCYLLFVGEDIGSTYTKELKESIEGNRIIITGWSDAQTFKNYLAMPDIGVQLRTQSRGETSAAVLDCMNYGIATIVNANGSNKELPTNSVYMLKDAFKNDELTLALERLYNNQQQRETLGKNAKEHIAKYHSPKQCAKAYYQAIEEAYQNQNQEIKSKIESRLKSSVPSVQTKELVKTISLSPFESIKSKQILVDVSSIVKVDLKTGIQRVVRSQLLELISNAPINYKIEPVYLVEKDGDIAYYYARAYTSKLLNLQSFTLLDEPISLNSADIFYGLDLSAYEVSKSLDLYKKYKALGAKITFVVYDLLPITHPEFFPSDSKATHTQWLDNITNIADQLISISQSVEDEVAGWIKEHKPQKLNEITLNTLHVGADLHVKNTRRGRPVCLPKNSNIDSFQSKGRHTGLPLQNQITFLMVGTIEPRKGHDQTLKAFEQLWQEGFDIHLKIVGKKGWMMNDFIEKLTNHPKLNQNLFYLESINDKELTELYNSSNALIIASQAEGFGLPLIEAAHHALPIIARDIPVFREVAKEYAYYFNDNLFSSIKDWIDLYKKDAHPKSTNMPYLTWNNNAKKLLKIFK